MPEVYDIALIGSGPVAVAALAALPEGMKIVIATGEKKSAACRETKTHFKIRAVAAGRREKPGVISIPFLGSKKGHLVDSATPGGLANYWGQQFVRYEESDPWPRDVFASHSEYIHDCARIEALFTCSPGVVNQEY